MDADPGKSVDLVDRGSGAAGGALACRGRKVWPAGRALQPRVGRRRRVAGSVRSLRRPFVRCRAIPARVNARPQEEPCREQAVGQPLLGERLEGPQVEGDNPPRNRSSDRPRNVALPSDCPVSNLLRTLLACS
jgi:hypothetical protein